MAVAERSVPFVSRVTTQAHRGAIAVVPPSPRRESPTVSTAAAAASRRRSLTASATPRSRPTAAAAAAAAAAALPQDALGKQTGLVVVLILCNIVGVAFQAMIIHNARGKDVPCIPGDGEPEKKLIKAFNKYVSNALHVIKMIPLVLTVVAIDQIEGFWARVAAADCTDGTTQKTLNFIAKEFPDVKEKNTQSLVIEALSLAFFFAMSVLACVKDKNAAYVQPDEEPNDDANRDPVRLVDQPVPTVAKDAAADAPPPAAGPQMPAAPMMVPQMGAPMMVPQMGAPQMGAPMMVPQMGAPQMGAPMMMPQMGAPQMGAPMMVPQMVAPIIGAPMMVPQMGAPQMGAPMIVPQMGAPQMGAPMMVPVVPQMGAPQMGAPS